ncbi:glutathione-disulfide reductase [Cereibacter azotoformans]|uniref:Glutathione reductase n=2 Tax=Cereibacter TaxID=1653176 RepID=A0A2T5JWM4_9RHOB|nr:glutathione-disulfide reductase [Cereibacter azotoformans]AXQ92993.1 glutathione-disulfide reductase [Cereibacter sphaeroides]MBO4169321.1 glutathione-disulfide reductase [Cereibacter azotoformans]PTR14579.1 NADPH-glutathione reductase [Cereibacter azotoformans]UIJ31290.1 glutathione-disulfide reductase [Cereibacter azotoformans]ULB09099.1 glutathione-disulfide reductase [Cereibacter azotoformans]
MAFDHDLFVIGGGSGGVRAARIAASEGGAKVALAEESRMGGTCVIRGCVPKKLMVFASGYPEAVEDARAYGWEASIGGFDWPKFRTSLDRELDRLEAAYRSGLTSAGVEIFDERATVADAHTVRLASGRTVTAKHILIATGGRPFVPDFPGCELALTSDDVFRLESLPPSILVVGGGYIASEFACILHGLGVDVCQFYRGAQILRGFDDEARGHVSSAMIDRGIQIKCGTDVIRLERTEGGVRAITTDGSDREFGAVLYATGRRPNSAGLGLEALGIELGRHGQIPVDDWSQTCVPSIYAVGDVTDRINLTPVAIREGHAFADTVFKGEPRTADHELVPSAVFTQPELGSVGLTEEAAREQEPIEVYAAAFRPMQSLFAGRPDRVLMKLIVSQASRKVLGCHIVAPNAGEMIQLAAIAVKMGATKEDFDRTVAVHPTMAEELVTLRKPVRTA